MCMLLYLFILSMHLSELPSGHNTLMGGGGDPNTKKALYLEKQNLAGMFIQMMSILNFVLGA